MQNLAHGLDCLKLASFEKFASAMLQTVAKRCLSSHDHFCRSVSEIILYIFGEVKFIRAILIKCETQGRLGKTHGVMEGL